MVMTFLQYGIFRHWFFTILVFLRSPLKVKDDDEVDKLDIKLDAKKKSKRVYQSPSPEVGLKISRSLKVSLLLNLNYGSYHANLSTNVFFVKKIQH